MSDLLSTCCSDFSRARLLRRAVAEAGRGLPEIEPGMPLPAGTGMTRRGFISAVSGLAISVYGAAHVAPRLFEAGIAHAATQPRSPVLVSIFMEGGADALSVLYPAADPLYRKLRPGLALDPAAGTAFTEDPRLYWHPAAKSLATLHGEGKVTVFPAIGYTGSDESHFTSRHYWEVGATDIGLHTGWLGRYLDRAGSDDNPLQGVSLDAGLAPALATQEVPVAAISDPNQYRFWARGASGKAGDVMLDALGQLGAAHAGSTDAGLRKAGRVAAQSHRLEQRMKAFKPENPSTAGYPSGAVSLATVAQLLGAGLPIRCVAVGAPGAYDTHANQPGALAQGLKLTADSILAFQRDLERRGLADRVLIHVWSEFGRRAAENASSGTDHGAAGVGFLIGARASGTMVGEYPGLSSLDANGNVKATSDFRGVYSALLEQWFHADAAPIIPSSRSFKRPKLVR